MLIVIAVANKDVNINLVTDDRMIFKIYSIFQSDVDFLNALLFHHQRVDYNI